MSGHVSRAAHYIVLLFCVVFCVASPTNSDARQQSLELAGVLMIQPGSNAEWLCLDYDDSWWQKTVLPGDWLPGGRRLASEHAWGRFHFELPTGFETEGLGIRLGVTNHCDAVYINGVEVGRTGDVDSRFYLVHPTVSVYPIPDGVLREGDKNVIAIHLLNFVGEPMGLSGPVVIEPYASAMIAVEPQQRLFRLVKGIDLGVSATFFLAAWILWLMVPGRAVFALVIFETAMLLVPLSQALTYAFDDHGTQVPAFYDLYISSAVAMPLAILAYQTSLFGYRFTKLMWATVPVSAFVIVVNWLGIDEQGTLAPQFPSTTTQWTLVAIIRLNFGVQMFLVMWLMFRSLWNQKPGAIPLALGLASMMILGFQMFIDLRQLPFFTNWTWSAPMVLGWSYRLFMLLGVIYAYRKSESDIRSLSDRVLYAQDQERSRLARDLHDGVAQTLHAVRLQGQQLAAGLDSETGDKVRAIADGVKDAGQELRYVANDLKPAILIESTLAEALEWYAGQVEARLGVTVSIRSSRQGDVPASMSQDLFRIAQEAISNAARHGNAQNIWLTVGKSGKVWRLTVEDDGRGLDESTGNETFGNGLCNIQDRAALLGGTADLRKRKPTGAVVDVRLPS